MAGGYQVPPADVLAELVQILRDARARLRELEALDGSQIYNTVQDLKNLIAGLLDATDINVSGNITAGGTITANTAYNSLATYSRDVSGFGGFRTMSVNIIGMIGYASSSLRNKELIGEASERVTKQQLRDLRLVFFRYLAAAPFDQEQQPILLGLLAEQVHEIGLTWLVIYDEKGRPESLVDFAVPFLGLLLAQMLADDYDALEERVAAIEKRA
jgi:hypothetical protein